MYCGVSPHFEATLTTRSASPSWSARLDGSPRSVLIGWSKIDMATSMPASVAGEATVHAMAIQGTCDDRFSAVREAFEANFVERDDTIYDAGASVAVTLDGELVVDLWGGTVDTDADRDVPWERDTIVNVWSTTKTVSALACLMLADQGELDFYAPVARYWPEFKAGGKGDVEVRHVMSHTAGLVGMAGADHAPRTCTTGRRRRRCSPPRSRGGSRARRRATTPSRRATSRVSSCAGSRGRRSASSSPPR